MGHIPHNNDLPPANREMIPISVESEETLKAITLLKGMKEATGLSITSLMEILQQDVTERLASIRSETNAKINNNEFLVPVASVPNLEEIATRLGVEITELEDEILFAERAMTPEVKMVSLIDESGEQVLMRVERRSVQPVKNKYGEFMLFKFRVDDKWGDYYALTQRKGFDRDAIMPTFEDKDELLVRIDSGCTCGMTFLDQSCDCRLQLHKAMKMITEKGEGMILHIPGQDGRGMGHEFKASTEILKDKGFTTVEAAVHLAKSGYIDGRTYAGSLAVASALGVDKKTRYNFMTNNPNKLDIYEMNGHEITNTPIVVEHHPDAEMHLKAKEEHMGHKREGKLERKGNGNGNGHPAPATT